jgi:hypothetical protein
MCGKAQMSDGRLCAGNATGHARIAVVIGVISLLRHVAIAAAHGAATVADQRGGRRGRAARGCRLQALSAARGHGRLGTHSAEQRAGRLEAQAQRIQVRVHSHLRRRVAPPWRPQFWQVQVHRPVLRLLYRKLARIIDSVVVGGLHILVSV